ncbi:MAG: hypothetical protein Q7S16_02490 [bacterium]|nr:hypothetical protein [bacterium]
MKVKKSTVFFETPLRARLAQEPLLMRSPAMEFAMQLPLRVLGFPARTFREDPAPGDCLEKLFDGGSSESNALDRVRKRAVRVETRLSFVTENDVGVAVQFFEKGEGEHFAELVTSFSLATGLHHGVGLNEPARRKAMDDITVIVKRVDYNRNPQQSLDATGRKQYTDKAIVATMPKRGNGIQENVPFTWFRSRRFLSPAEVQIELEAHGLVRDLYAQVAANAQDPAFADDHRNGMSWELPGGGYGYMAFGRDGDGRRYVDVCRNDDGWRVSWSFGGVPEDALGS